MKIYPDKLAGQLKQGLAPVYLVSGDEPLQLMECCDAIRAQLRAAGCNEREIMHVETGFDWRTLHNQACTMSLFSEKRLLELRIPSAKPGKEGSQAIQAFCNHPPEDDILLIICGKLERESQNSAWYKAIDKIGVVVQIWPVEHAQLPAWIARRMQQAGLRPAPQAEELIATRIEGNLLAASQEIEKLRLLYGEGNISVEQVLDAVADSARYDIFGLVDAALAGDAVRVVRMLDGLRGEGEESILILWALTKEVRALLKILDDTRQGVTMDTALSRQRVWDKRKALYQTALQRHPAGRLEQMLRLASRIDQVVKGQRSGNVWDELLELGVWLAGRRLIRPMANL